MPNLVRVVGLPVFFCARQEVVQKTPMAKGLPHYRSIFALKL